MTSSDWIRLFGTLFATLVGAYAAYRLASSRERERDERLHETLRRAMRAEIAACGNLANTYLKKEYLAPAYRFQNVVHDAVFSQLLASGQLDIPQVTSIIEFYSQVKQLNWCMDKIESILRTMIDLPRKTNSGERLPRRRN